MRLGGVLLTLLLLVVFGDLGAICRVTCYELALLWFSTYSFDFDGSIGFVDWVYSVTIVLILVRFVVIVVDDRSIVYLCLVE